MAGLIKRRGKGDAAKEKIQAFTIETQDSAFAKSYPALAEFLSLETWGEGEARTRGTLTIFWEEGMFKASVNNRDSEEVAFVAKQAFKGLLDAVEKGLAADSLDWRSQARKGQGKGKRA